jgi:hypothetical protein
MKLVEKLSLLLQVQLNGFPGPGAPPLQNSNPTMTAKTSRCDSAEHLRRDCTELIAAKMLE